MRTVESWLEIAENALKAAINANSLNNIKQNEMKRDEIVEKIMAIDGVMSVTYSDDNAVVQFEKEVELVDGEIYFCKDDYDDVGYTFRFKSRLNNGLVGYYSSTNPFELDGEIIPYDESRKCKPATKKQKKKLIKAEIKNGFFWELEKNN